MALYAVYSKGWQKGRGKGGKGKGSFRGASLPKGGGQARCANCGDAGHSTQACPKPRVDPSQRLCFICNERGHRAANCPKKPTGGKGANMASNADGVPYIFTLSKAPETKISNRYSTLEVTENCPTSDQAAPADSASCQSQSKVQNPAPADKPHLESEEDEFYIPQSIPKSTRLSVTGGRSAIKRNSVRGLCEACNSHCGCDEKSCCQEPLSQDIGT